MSNQDSLDFGTKSNGPVECLGQTFESDEARRAHFTELLREKLKDSDFRKIEGFPIGEDEDILNLSDPPYYTACPNPWIGDFIAHYGKPYDPKVKYHREPFAADVSEGKNHPIYNAHSYHTKVPHRAIMRYILHYTEPGDVVFDGFCGTGMTGVAAQLCGDMKEVSELGYRVDGDGIIYNEEGKSFSKLGARRAIINDLSTIATNIAASNNQKVDTIIFDRTVSEKLRKVEEAYLFLYETNHADEKKGIIDYIVWSKVLSCPECGHNFNYYYQTVIEGVAEVKKIFQCPSCGSELGLRDCEQVREKKYDVSLGATVGLCKSEPVIIYYRYKGKRYEKVPDEEDISLIEEIESMPVENWHPTSNINYSDKTGEPKKEGIDHVHQIYTKRNLIVLAALWDSLALYERSIVTSFLENHANKRNRYLLDKHHPVGTTGGPLPNTLYIAPLSCEVNIFNVFKKTKVKFNKAHDHKCAYPDEIPSVIISTSSASSVNIKPDSLDYIFIDPPFGQNIMYSDLNTFWESWLRCFTNNKQEAVVSKCQEKNTGDYRSLMVECLRSMYIMLKPNRWITVEFSNTSASVWNSIQSAITEVGFIIANVSALDKKRGGMHAALSPVAVKQDLVISAYKPDGGLEARFAKHGDSIEGVWDFLQTHLKNLPVVKPKGGTMEFIAERDPRILYDRMVAFYVGHNTPVPLSSGEFQADLHEKFPERDGMYFLHEQVAEYDKKAAQMENIGQMAIFVEDEKSAINWLRSYLKDRPSVYSDIQPEYMKQIQAGMKKQELMPDLSVLLDQNFIKYFGESEVPSQIHSYLSTNFKDLRGKEKDDPALVNKAKDRWYVPDPKKMADVEAVREKRLLNEFWEYLPDGYAKPQPGDTKQAVIPGMESKAKPKGKTKKLKEVRTEAVRIGFKTCFQNKDYATILAVSSVLPNNVVEEDEQLQMIYDMAEMRSE